VSLLLSLLNVFVNKELEACGVWKTKKLSNLILIIVKLSLYTTIPQMDNIICRLISKYNSINKLKKKKFYEENVEVTGPCNVDQIQHLKHLLRCNTSEASMVQVWLV